MKAATKAELFDFARYAIILVAWLVMFGIGISASQSRHENVPAATVGRPR